MRASRNSSKPVDKTSKTEIAQVGAISANNDPIIGDLIADAMMKVGTDGVITVEEAKGTDTTIEVVEGMQFDRGYLSPYFVTDAETMEAVDGGCRDPDSRQKDFRDEGPSPDSGEGRSDRISPFCHC